MGETLKTFPTLYTKDKDNNLRVWNLSIELGFASVDIITEHGLKDGQQQRDVVSIKSGKNIGKANETTPLQQATLEAESKWNKMVSKGYSTNKKSIEHLLPMLAKKYTEYKHKIVFPCYVQPKLDGVRCLTKRINGIIEFLSRNGKKYTNLMHIANELKTFMAINDIFDGEIYVHGVIFQDLISSIKNVKNKSLSKFDCKDLEYHIYDYADSNKNFYERYKILLDKIDSRVLKHIVMVPTIKVGNEKEIMEWHKRFVSYGYEGIIIRNKDGKYEFNFRSDNLQKYKEFQDEEFKIVDVKRGVGRYSNCATFVCITEDNKIFDCNPKCSIEKKEEYWLNRRKYIGKLLTVRFQEKTKDGKPRFPIGISIRDYE